MSTCIENSSALCYVLVGMLVILEHRRSGPAHPTKPRIAEINIAWIGAVLGASYILLGALKLLGPLLHV